MKILTKADKPEVTNVSQFGIWVVASGSEFFISYSDYPVFEGAPLLSVVKVEAEFASINNRYCSTTQ